MCALKATQFVILYYGSLSKLKPFQFRLKLKKVGKTTKPFQYDLNHHCSSQLPGVWINLKPWPAGK